MKFTEFPVVKELKHPDKSKLIKYVALMYGKDSPIRNIDSIEARHNEACARASLAPADHMDLFPPKKDTIYSTLIFQYLAYFENNNKFMSLLANQQLFWRMQRIIMDPDSSINEATKASADSDDLQARIDQQYNDIFGVSSDAAKTETSKVIMMTPEKRVPKAS